MNMNEPAVVATQRTFQAEATASNYCLSCVQTNRQSIGLPRDCALWKPAQAQEVNAQSSFYSANDRRLTSASVLKLPPKLTIRWTNGKMETMQTLLLTNSSCTRSAGIYPHHRSFVNIEGGT